MEQLQRQQQREEKEEEEEVAHPLASTGCPSLGDP
jgi:hypothetical protein